MKHLKIYLSLIIVTFAACILVSSCARKEAFEKSVIVPSADGQVKVKKDKNNNYSISISVRDLAPPNDLTPSKKTYVVWSETGNTGTQNLGQLNSSRSFLARGYKASLNAVSTSNPKRIFITAEDDGNTQYPGNQVVLTTGNF